MDNSHDFYLTEAELGLLDSAVFVVPHGGNYDYILATLVKAFRHRDITIIPDAVRCHTTVTVGDEVPEELLTSGPLPEPSENVDIVATEDIVIKGLQKMQSDLDLRHGLGDTVKRDFHGPVINSGMTENDEEVFRHILYDDADDAVRKVIDEGKNT